MRMESSGSRIRCESDAPCCERDPREVGATWREGEVEDPESTSYTSSMGWLEMFAAWRVAERGFGLRCGGTLEA